MSIFGLIWISLSYLFGSLPFGSLVARFSGKTTSWQKTSGATNVFRNIGKWQGVLTGILDLTKGYLAVYFAQKLGLSLGVQVFSGVAVVVGHNWSIFLRFGGGRGVAAFFGAFLALSPKILIFSLAPLITIALIWESAIATVFFLVSAILISIYFHQFAGVGFFVLLSLGPILIKRLSPLAELKPPLNIEKLKLIRNRLIFDNDQLILDFRIKRILKKLKIIRRVDT